MTVAEAEMIVAGYMRSQKDQLRIAAWSTMHQLNIWIPKGKHIKSPGELMGEKTAKSLPNSASALQRVWMSDARMK